MKKNTKKTYLAPVINVITVELEQGIAAGSGTPVNSSGPTVDNWTGGETQQNNVDF